IFTLACAWLCVAKNDSCHAQTV
ncbi:DNA photolyase family protein, partial [Vibrio parahaemolyticus EKP-028]